ncbi:hypothetical protein ABZ619_40740 [Streptomyces sp. NPDC007851]|uniref:hypothetical protein n=1 Tax=Streptomyces sp. NPDC007851 TaxID=3155008 RepID=UPI0033CA1024
MTSASLAACGSGATGATGEHARQLSKAELERATVTATDLDGYEVQRDLASTSASHKTADPSSCAPAMQAVGGSSGFAATARTARIVFSKKHGPSAHLTLSSHSPQDAERVIDALRTAAERCKTFKDVQVDFDYDGVQVRSGPGYGDESVSLRLTQLVAGGADEESVRVPYAVVAVRQGATVAMFTTFNRPKGQQAADPAVVPDAVVRAQLTKLRKLTASE